MSPLDIFGLQFAISVVVFALVAKWYVAPWLAGKPANQALSVLILPHTLRHVGLTFMVPGMTAATIPTSFAAAAGYGDFASGLLALLALVALRGSWRVAPALVWVFNIVGTADLLNALRQVEVIEHLGAMWFVPTFLVPVLLVTHAMIFVRLLKPGTAKAGALRPHTAH